MSKYSSFAVITLAALVTTNQSHAGWLDNLQNKWNSIGKISEKDWAQYPTVQEYFTAKFDSPRHIVMNNVSYGAGTIMWERAKAYCDRDGGNFVQVKAHPVPLIPYRGSELLDSPNLQKYYGLFECQNIQTTWKVYFDHQNEFIGTAISPNTNSDVSYSFE